MDVLPDGNLLAVGTDIWPAGHLLLSIVRAESAPNC